MLCVVYVRYYTNDDLLNHVLLIGVFDMSAGRPASICGVLFIGVARRGKPKTQTRKPKTKIRESFRASSEAFFAVDFASTERTFRFSFLKIDMWIGRHGT